MLGLIGRVLWFAFILIFPFIFLIRFSVYLHVHEKLIPWACIGGGIIFTTVILFLYFTFLYGRFSGVNKDRPNLLRRLFIAFAMVGIYCLHGLFYMSGDNMKRSDIKSEVRKVHPILRLSVSTLIHLDKELIITDADRSPEDYKKMGLKSISHSLHYQQSNGYAHAMDLRTKGRSELRNLMTEYFFRLMGFKTLRHVGTADHLHISLLSHDRPSAR